MMGSRGESPRSGFVFLFSLFILVGTLALTTLGLSRSVTELSAANRYVAKQRAFQAAEAGLDEALRELAKSTGSFLGWETPASCPAGTTCLAKTLPLASSGLYTVTVINPAGTSPTIRSTGSAPVSSNPASNVQQTIAAVVSRGGPAGFQPFFGRDGVALGSQSGVDAYDSSRGPYGGTNRTQAHSITTNSTSAGAISLGIQAIVDGDVVVGPGGFPGPPVISQRAQSVITGTKTAAQTAYTPVPIQVPSGSPCGTNALVVRTLRTRTMSVSDFLSGCYAAISVGRMGGLTLTGDGQIALTNLSVLSMGSLVLNGNITLVTEGLGVGNQATIQIPAGNRVTVYARGSVGFGTQSEINNVSRIPKNFALYYTGTGTLGLGVQGALYGFVYAPEAAVSLRAQSGFYGGVIARSVTLGNQNGFHYDAALVQACADLSPDPSSCPGGTGSSEPPRLRLWQQE